MQVYVTPQFWCCYRVRLVACFSQGPTLSADTVDNLWPRLPRVRARVCKGQLQTTKSKWKRICMFNDKITFPSPLFVVTQIGFCLWDGKENEERKEREIVCER
jgi:hypothetical protein